MRISPDPAQRPADARPLCRPESQSHGPGERKQHSGSAHRGGEVVRATSFTPKHLAGKLIYCVKCYPIEKWQPKKQQPRKQQRRRPLRRPPPNPRRKKRPLLKARRSSDHSFLRRRGAGCRVQHPVLPPNRKLNSAARARSVRRDNRSRAGSCSSANARY